MRFPNKHPNNHKTGSDLNHFTQQALILEVAPYFKSSSHSYTTSHRIQNYFTNSTRLSSWNCKVPRSGKQYVIINTFSQHMKGLHSYDKKPLF